MTVQIRGLRNADLPKVQQILEEWVRDPDSQEVLRDEVAAAMAELRDALEAPASTRSWVAVTPEDSVIGTVGMRAPTEEVLTFAEGSRPVELVHAFVKKGNQHRGTGTLLVAALETEARRTGHDEVLVNSGPRYAESWGFYDRLQGFERRGTARDYYGPGQDARVWGKLL